ncbi:MAG: transcriptional repressor [Deltaproteobacteria bacterium]|nr:transcriptional repressor [Deltaproteobacteria bacterium]
MKKNTKERQKHGKKLGNTGHSKELGEFYRLFRDEGIERVEDRLKVLTAFLSSEEHMSAARLTQMLEEGGHPFDIEFVRETLRLLCRYGFAQRHHFEGGKSLYEHRHLGHHHDHFICTRCGAITEFYDEALEKLQANIARKHGFRVLQHRMELYGLCENCNKDRFRPLSLTAAKAGETVVIRELSGGSEARRRLLSMGLRTGDVLEVLINTGDGQVVVVVDGRRYALGRGLAEKIFVAAHVQ